MIVKTFHLKKKKKRRAFLEYFPEFICQKKSYFSTKYFFLEFFFFENSLFFSQNFIQKIYKNNYGVAGKY